MLIRLLLLDKTSSGNLSFFFLIGLKSYIVTLQVADIPYHQQPFVAMSYRTIDG